MAVGSNANFQIGEELSNTGTGKVNPNGKGLMPSANVNSSYTPGTKAFDEQQRVNNNALQAPATRAGGIVQTGLSGNNTGGATGSINFNAGVGAPKTSNPGTTVAGGNFSTNGGKSGADIGTSTFTPLKADGTLATTPASTTSSSSTGLPTATTDGTSPIGTNGTPAGTSTTQTGTTTVPSTGTTTTVSTPSSTSTTGSSTASGGTQGGTAGGGTPEVYTADNLDPTLKAQYNLMTPDQQKAFITAGVNGAAAQIQYLAQAKEAKDNMTANYNATQQINANKNAAQNVQDQATILDAQTKLSNLHESLTYLGAGQPGKAATTALAVNQMLTQAATSLSAMQYAENVTQTNQGIAKQLDSTNFAYKIGQLQDSINQNVDQAIQGALSQASSADIRGLLDSPEKVEAFGSALLADVDQRVGGMMSASTQQMDYLVQANNAFTQQMQTTFKNSQTVNTDMSGALGHYVDMNGNPMVDANGAQIPFAQTPPIAPQFDASTGLLTQFSLGPDGKIIATQTQVGSSNASSAAMNTLAQQVANGTMKATDVPKSITDSPGRANALAAAYQNPGGTGSGGSYDFSTVQNPGFQQGGSDAAVNDNNPGNLRASSATQYPGQIGVSPNGFAIFSSVQGGWNALTNDIAAKQAGGPNLPAGSTLQDMINFYAPASDGNNPTAYAQAVANKLGVTVDTPISQIDNNKLSLAIAQHESSTMGTLLTTSAAGQNISQGSNNAPGTTADGSIDINTPGYADKPVVGSWTQAAIDQAAIQFAMTGKMPSLGLSANQNVASIRAAISNRAAQLNKGGQITSNAADLKADTSNLTKQVNYLGQQQRAIKSADAEFTTLTNLFKASGVNDQKTPLANMMANYTKYNLGSSDVPAFQAALSEIASQYAAVYTQTAGGLSDTAKAQAADILAGNLSMSALSKINDTLQAVGKVNIGVAKDSVKSAQDDINSIIPGLYKTSDTTTPDATTPTDTNTTNGGRIFDNTGSTSTGGRGRIFN